MAHLTKLQIQLLPSGIRVIGLTKLQVQEFINVHPDFVEVILSLNLKCFWNVKFLKYKLVSFG